MDFVPFLFQGIDDAPKDNRAFTRGQVGNVFHQDSRGLERLNYCQESLPEVDPVIVLRPDAILD